MLSSFIKRIFAFVLLFPAIIGATAVLSRQVVADCGVVEGDIGVRNPATSVEELGAGGLSAVLS